MKDERQPLRGYKYPFGSLKLGGFFPFEMKDYARVCAAMQMYGKRHGKTFRLSKFTLRCWRVR